MPIVHVHGFAISGEYLMPTARRLAGRWVNVVPDLPGYGRSERRDRVLDIPALAQALMAILDALDIDKAVLVGNSMGCPVGLEVAHAAPERVHRLVLVSPAGGVHNRPLARALGQLARDGIRESPRMFPVALPDYVKFGPINGLRLFHELTLYPSLERLLQTPVPTLAVLGVRDPLMPPAARVREVARLAPEHLTVAVVEKAAHAVNFSHPEELSGTIEAWLDDAIVEGAHLPDGVRVYDNAARLSTSADAIVWLPRSPRAGPLRLDLVPGQLGSDAGVEVEVGHGERHVRHQDGVGDSGDDVGHRERGSGGQDQDRAEDRPDGPGQQDRRPEQDGGLDDPVPDQCGTPAERLEARWRFECDDGHEEGEQDDQRDGDRGQHDGQAEEPDEDRGDRESAQQRSPGGECEAVGPSYVDPAPRSISPRA